MRKYKVPLWVWICVISMLLLACSKKRDDADKDSDGSLNTDPLTNVDTDSTGKIDSDSGGSTDLQTGTDSGSVSDPDPDSDSDSYSDSDSDSDSSLDSGLEEVDTERKLVGRLVPGAVLSSRGNKVLQGAVEPVYQGKTSSAGTRQLIHLGITVEKE